MSENQTATLSVVLFEATAGTLYSLDTSARLAGISRRAVLLYCNAGLVKAVMEPPFGTMAFSEESIHTLRRIEHLRAAHGLGLAWIKTLFGLLAEVEHLRAEVRFFEKR